MVVQEEISGWFSLKPTTAYEILKKLENMIESVLIKMT